MIQINNKLRDKAFKCACDHGFHDKKYTIEHWFVLIISEIIEFIEADRKNKHADVITFKEWQFKFKPVGEKYDNECFKSDFERYIKDTVEDELADIIIRCLDLAGLYNIFIYKLYPPIFKHEIPQATDFGYHCTGYFYIDTLSLQSKIQMLIMSVFEYSQSCSIDLLWHIEQKMRYNELRPILNGKKY